MSDDIAIKVAGLGKKYRVGQRWNYFTSFREALARRLKSTFRGNSEAQPQEFWALRDVSFDVKTGEAISIIGRNGAGKSTLLRILSRITCPTTGSAEVRGSARSLLEVGTGFHPELTGRENIFLNGAFMGMRRREIERKLDAIVDFSEVGKFLDTPVKRYSSGMYIRLAFSVAAHLEPDILIVDEVLAVGDTAFQRRCLGKMQDAGRDGRTVLFVSHDLQAVSALTSRSVVLSEGQVAFSGSTADAIGFYLKQSDTATLSYTAEPSPVEARIVAVRMMTTDAANVQQAGEPMDIEIDISMPQPIAPAVLVVQACSTLQQPLLFLTTARQSLDFCSRPGRWTVKCRIDKLRLFLGRYHLRVTLKDADGSKVHEVVSNACPFEVTQFGDEVVRNSDQYGIYAEDGAWTCDLVQSPSTVEVTH